MDAPRRPDHAGPQPPPADQAEFAAALLDPALPCPPGLRAWNASDPTRRLAVYRNNVVASLVDALADTFPVTQQLVGTEFFRAMAAVFVRRQPPRTRILAHYGDEFAAFVAGFAPAAGLPYLPDMARLEFARLHAWHAGDAEPIAEAVLARALADPPALADMRFAWHPSLQPIESPHAVVSLWAAHQVDGEVQEVAIDRAEQAVVLRDGLEVLVLPVDAGTARFVARTRAGAAFAAAAAEAAALDPAFDLGRTLALLLRHRALVALLAAGADAAG
jgi:hypothetical protein